MKPTQTRIADLWCKLMHKDPMWPSHGHYECRSCGRLHQVCWEGPTELPKPDAALLCYKIDTSVDSTPVIY